jgi:ABC-2 type transport system permease protein
MLKGFWKLSWVETKVFVREPMGFITTLVVPVMLFLFLGKMFRASPVTFASMNAAPFNVAILAALIIALGSVQSLVAIIAIYREGGILKRLRATPLSPVTILGAQVGVKLVFALVSLGLLVLAGKRVFPAVMDVNLFSFSAALLLGTLSILSLGFLLASLVPTARFAQPISTAVLYPMLALSGVVFPLERLPKALQIVALALPTTHAAALMQASWDGSGWTAHWMNAVALIVFFAVCTALSTKVFRWE